VHQLSPGGFVPRAPEQVVREIAWCVETLGARDVAFYDDALLASAENHVQRILDGVIRGGLQARFHTPNGLHARLIDGGLARKMRQAGFVTLRLGLETIDAETQRRDGRVLADPGHGRMGGRRRGGADRAGRRSAAAQQLDLSVCRFPGLGSIQAASARGKPGAKAPER
jgi:hypothetical protein